VRTLDLHEAHRQGLLTKRVQHTIFDVKGIKNTESGTNLSFNEAVEAGALNVQAERVVDLRSRQSYMLSDAARENLIDPMLQVGISRVALLVPHMPQGSLHSQHISGDSRLSHWPDRRRHFAD
jgi:hypothetical protein